MLKKLFPFSFEQAAVLKTKLPFKFTCKEETANMLVCVLTYLVASLLAGFVFGIAGFILGLIPILGAIAGWILGIIGSVFGLYCLAGIVVHLLLHFNVIKAN